MNKKSSKVINKLHTSTQGGFIKILPVNLLLVYFLSMTAAFSQNDTTIVKQKKSKTSEKDILLFSSDSLLEVTLYLDLTAFAKKPGKGDSFDAEMKMKFSETDSLNKEINIKYRGISRYEICSFPPMQIKFRNSIISDSGKIKKLKLVTHCEPGNLSDDYILREYLCYKLYNVLTDSSFRVRLLKIDYVDSKNNKKTIRKYGFFIEPISTLAERMNAVEVKSQNLNQINITPEVMDRLAIFNYMISTWDWSVPGQHNVKVIKSKSDYTSTLGIAIPYDFDLTGVVNAEYAIPPPDKGIENIRERLFLGICQNKEVYMSDLKKFLLRKADLYSVINDFPYLNKRGKKDITLYLDTFFDKLEKQKSMENLAEYFTNNCKKF